MGELKTIISANIPVSLAKQLQGKTRGTRSRVVTRALKAYLADKEAFNITDYPTRNVMAALMSRDDCPEHIKILLLQELSS